LGTAIITQPFTSNEFKGIDLGVGDFDANDVGQSGGAGTAASGATMPGK
jgi:hypothetical protein